MIYAYKTINTINNKVYYGVHKSQIDGLDNYIGCGIRRQSDARLNCKFHCAVRKHGYNNFKVEKIKEFDSFKDALAWESTFITEDIINDINCYNSKLGGRGGSLRWTEEKKQLVKSRGNYRKSAETKAKLSAAAKERFSKEPGTFKGKKHSIKTRELFSFLRKGKKNPHGAPTRTPELMIKWVNNINRNRAKIHATQIANKKIQPAVEETIKREYSGVRGEKVQLAKKYNCSITLITKIVGLSFTHNKNK